MDDSRRLLILGASVRAAACSALRGGFVPWCGDLFADVDLAARCEAHRADPYPADLLRISRESPPGPWMYTGGLENQPKLVEAISAERRLFGNSGAVLRNVRDPLQLADRLPGFPDCASVADNLPKDGTWLRKKLHSCGGLAIHPWDEHSGSSGHEPGYFFQRRLKGLSCAGLFVSARGVARLLGVTEQMIGGLPHDTSGFRYRGSIGPVAPTDCERQDWQRIGDLLASEFHLQGLFGVDAICAEGMVRPVEVNPRYPASAEILERAYGFSAVRLHVSACRDGVLPDPLQWSQDACIASRFLGKSIVFASHDLRVSEEFAQRLTRASLVEPWPDVADVPAAGSAIPAGWPICTVYAAARDRASVIAALQRAP